MDILVVMDFHGKKCYSSLDERRTSLADILRPKVLDEVLGQKPLVGKPELFVNFYHLTFFHH